MQPLHLHPLQPKAAGMSSASRSITHQRAVGMARAPSAAVVWYWSLRRQTVQPIQGVSSTHAERCERSVPCSYTLNNVYRGITGPCLSCICRRTQLVAAILTGQTSLSSLLVLPVAGQVAAAVVTGRASPAARQAREFLCSYIHIHHHLA